MKTNGNEPITAIKDVGFDVDTESIAFDPSKADFRVSFGGLTKREYFAAMAMSGILADVRSLSDGSLKTVAESSASIADFLIEALNKEEQS